MDATELLMRRRNVAAFIDADPVNILITREAEPTKSAAGGYVKAPSATLPQQKARIVQAKRRYDTGLINSEAGELPQTDYLLIGNTGIDVKVNDVFQWLGQTYKVLGIHPTRTESTLCAIEFDGPDNGR